MNGMLGAEYDNDALARRLDDDFPPGEHDTLFPADTDPRLWAAWHVARGPHPVLDEETAARIEARLLATSHLLHARHPAVNGAASQTLETRAIARRRSAPQRWLSAFAHVAAVLLLLFVTLFGTMTVSARSLPGEPLYPVKRLVERGQLAFASDEQSLDLRLRFAERRLDEFEQLLVRGDVRETSLDDAVTELESAFKLVQRGACPVDVVADRMLSIAARHVSLAERANVPLADHKARLVQLVQSVSHAAAQSRRTHTNQTASQAADGAIPEQLQERFGRYNLAAKGFMYFEPTPAE